MVVFDRVCETFRDRRFNKLSTRRGHEPWHYQDHFAHHHHPRFVADDGVVDDVLRRRDAVLLLRWRSTIGILFGVYSSVFVAAAVAMWLGVKREDLLKPIKEKDETGSAVV